MKLCSVGLTDPKGAFEEFFFFNLKIGEGEKTTETV